MKHHIFKLAASIFGILAFSSCSITEVAADVPQSGLQDYRISIIAGGTKTAMEPSGTSGTYKAVWSDGDEMQIYIDEVVATAGHKYTLENMWGGDTATFTGSVGSNDGAHTIYGFYPASALGVESESKSVFVDIPYLQHPTLTSFDPSCDLLAAKPMDVNFTSGVDASINNAQFARQLAILKIVPTDNTSSVDISSDKVLSLKMNAEATLTGRAKLNLDSSKITDWTYQSAINYVKAEYDDNFSIKSTNSNAAFLMVAPGTLESGSTLDFTINTDQHLITKSVSLTKDITLTAGKITTLKVKIADSNVQSSGASLPFNEGFYAITVGGNTSTDNCGTQWNGNDNFPDVSSAYKAGGAVRLGTANSSGSLTTKSLNLASAFTVKLYVKGWSSIEGQIKVTAGSQSQTVAYANTMSGSFEEITVPFYGESSVCNVEIATTAKRCFIDSVAIISRSASTHNIVAADQVTLPAANGSTSTFTVASDYAWTTSSTGSGFTFSPESGDAGKLVTVTVTATGGNTDNSAKNLGSITISDGTASKTIAVQQSGNALGWAELPVVSVGTNQELCKHDELPSNSSLRNYSFLYDKTKHCAMWVAWPLHECYIGSASRTDGFGYDPVFINNTYEPNLCGAYYPMGGSTYSHARGHQMPSAERTKSQEDNTTTFYSTNMTPQLQGFNGGVWEELESIERNKFICSDTLYIITGPYFDPNVTATYAYDNKGNGKACQIPTHYWKVFLRTKAGNTGKKVSDCSASELQCVGFWFTHESRTGQPTASDMKSVKAIEDLTGLTFFPNVPNAPKTSYSASDWGL